MNTFKKITLTSAVAFALFTFNACGDDSGSSSGPGDNGGGRAGVPDTVQTMEELLSDVPCGESQKCIATYLVEFNDKAVCDGEDGWVFGTLIEKMDCDFAESSDSHDDEDYSSDSEDEDYSSDSEDDYSSDSDEDNYSSDSKKGHSSSSSCVIASSAGAKQSSGSSGNAAKVMPTGYYKTNCPAGLDCKDATSSLEYLNQEMLAIGKYGEMLDTRDGQVYKTTEICDSNNENCQTWMAQNLNYRYVGVKYSYSGYTSDSTSWCYGNSANCDKYGRLYTWSAVMDSAARFSVNAETKCGYGKTCTPNSPHRGICPEGWHVPTNEEYSSLYKNIGGSNTAGSLLKSTSGWEDNGDKSGNGIDRYGFSVVPAGFKGIGGGMKNEHYDAVLWTASEDDSISAWIQYFYFDHDYAYQGSNNKGISRSLRCLKD